jgi:antitoxin (DNA-binding transcriptional repressor) of toxin-antitoxin stability system
MRRHPRRSAKTAAPDHGRDSVKIVAVQDTNLEQCLKDAERQRLIIARNGKPIALLIGVKGKDREQVELGSSDTFWCLVGKWRQQQTMSRAELERRLAEE